MVSLATALSIPLYVDGGKAFPHRDLIIFITFVVILITLVFQGLTLPIIIRLTGIGELDPVLPDHEQHAGIRLRLDTVALQRLNARHTSASGNSMLRAYTEKLGREIEGNQVYLDSVEVCVNRDAERQVFQQVMADIHDPSAKSCSK